MLATLLSKGRFMDMLKTFIPNIFQETFNSYFQKWFIFSTVCFCLGFSMYTVTKLNIIASIGYALPTFLYPSAPPSFLYDVVELFGYSDLIGAILFGATTFGIFSIGPVAVGPVAIGGVSFGLFAIGGGTSLIGMVKNKCLTAGRAIGIVAISPKAYGFYTLSYRGAGFHCFSPSRHDAAAVALFTTLFPKLKRAFHSST